MSSTDAKVEQMFQILLDPQEKGTEKKQKVRGLGGVRAARQESCRLQCLACVLAVAPEARGPGLPHVAAQAVLLGSECEPSRGNLCSRRTCCRPPAGRWGYKGTETLTLPLRLPGTRHPSTLSMSPESRLLPLLTKGTEAQRGRLAGPELRASACPAVCMCGGGACPRHPVLPLTQASQNLVVLAREEAGAEKIFRNNGVQLLQRLLDTGEPNLMLAALRTLVGICSEHQPRVGGLEGLVLLQSVRPSTSHLPPPRTRGRVRGDML